MTRRILSLLLIPFVLLTQSVTFGHSHAGKQPAGHGLRSHIHLYSHAAGEAQGHTHSHGSIFHKHKNHAHTDQDNPVSDEMESPFDHDSSAVYLNSIDLASGSHSLLKTELLLSFHWNAIQADALASSLWEAAPEWSRRDCAPPGPASILFLRHHAFLI